MLESTSLAAPWTRACVSSVFHHANEFLCYNIITFFAKFDDKRKQNGSRLENVLEFIFFIHLVTHFFKKVKIDVEAPLLVQRCNGSKILYSSVSRIELLVQLEDAFCQV